MVEIFLSNVTQQGSNAQLLSWKRGHGRSEGPSVEDKTRCRRAITEDMLYIWCMPHIIHASLVIDKVELFMVRG